MGWPHDGGSTCHCTPIGLRASITGSTFDQGVEEGRKEARKSLLMAIEALTDVLGIEFSAERCETLDKAGIERLEDIVEALRSSRQWPAD
jgi:hypothetical protein